jgi:vitamin K-dependent gamma-carboxylase
VFFSPDWPDTVLSKVFGRTQALGSRAKYPRFELSPRRQFAAHWWTCAACVYCAWQILMPLRFLAYGGDVRWHEQGMRFSWRVMVREKNGSVTFLVRDPRTQREVAVAPRAYLTRLQEREMSGQPDLILQLAHRIRDDYTLSLGVPVEVRAEALVSLNGRLLAPMVDPNVDLSRIGDGLAQYTWVLPAPQTRPPHVRPV